MIARQAIATIAAVAFVACGDLDADRGWDIRDRPVEVADVVCEGKCCTTTTDRCKAVRCECGGQWKTVYLRCD